VSPTLQLERPVQRLSPPRLLVEWSSRWEEFFSCIRPAFARSERRLAGESPFGLVPLRIILPSYVIEAFLILALIAIHQKIEELQPYVAPRPHAHDVIYYSGDELPRTEDLGGAQSGRSGRAGGDESHHRTQTIKIARGGSLVPRVVDAPNLKLPSSRDAVANLLAIRPDPGPPPSEGMRSSRSAPRLQNNVVEPAKNLTHDYTRNGVSLDAAISPPPSVSRDRTATAPNLSATLIQPAPTVARETTLVAPLLAPAVIAPAQNVARDRSRNAPALSANIVAPAPNLEHDRGRNAPNVSPSVIPPAPGAVTRQLSSSPVQMANAVVVQPPVSAPERTSLGNPKLTLPAPAIIAPPPSADASHDLRRLSNGSVPDPSQSVIPPPPTQAGSGSFMSSLIGKIFGASEVVPPPKDVSAGGGTTRGGTGTSLNPNVIAPPASLGGNAAAGNPAGNRNGAGANLGSNVIAPPSTAGVSGGTGTRPANGTSASTLGPPSVVAPPPSLSGSMNGNGNNGGANGAPGGTLLASNVSPPPPSVGGGSGDTGSGMGRKGNGLGAPMNVGSNVAPPAAGGSGTDAGAVISAQPGSKVGLPTNENGGALAMSPTGGDRPGLGGAGGGNGIGHGNGPGSGISGEGAGAGKSGPGRGSDPNARGGISMASGPGGAGNAPGGVPPVPGVSVSGGSSVVTLESFGSDSGPSNDPNSNKRTSIKKRGNFDVDIVATASSGGAFEPYKNLLRGEKHTIYPANSVVMEYAEQTAAARNAAPLAPPQPLRTDLPAPMPRGRMVLICSLDASGNLRNIRVLEAGSADMTAKIMAALRSWKFQPALRGDQPVEVTAILGFGIDTNDRF